MLKSRGASQLPCWGSSIGSREHPWPVFAAILEQETTSDDVQNHVLTWKTCLPHDQLQVPGWTGSWSSVRLHAAAVQQVGAADMPPCPRADPAPAAQPAAISFACPNLHHCKLPSGRQTFESRAHLSPLLSVTCWSLTSAAKGADMVHTCTVAGSKLDWSVKRS